MEKLFSLGKLYPSDFLRESEMPRSSPVELQLILDDNGFVRLEDRAEFDVMYGKYWYRSGINNTMMLALKDVVDSILNVMKIRDGDLWLDIASNDGTLLSYVPSNLNRVGIDPADDTYKAEAEKHANLIIQDFFSAEAFQKHLVNARAKIITSIAVFYDLERPELFIRDVEKVLDDNGLWVMQLSYTPLMLTQLAFDNICHEHLFYYSLFNLKKLLEDNGFKIVDCQLNNVNGGSFRVYIMKQKGDERQFASKTHRDVCNFRINSILEYEKTLKMDSVETWMKFFEQVNELKEKTVDFIKSVRAQGKTVWAYGASTKGNTLLQYFGLDNTLIDAIAERSPAKYGMRTVGTNIPIHPESVMRAAKPDYLLVLPWHFIDEFHSREMDYLLAGGKFIVPCPKFEVLGA
jgi:NDP-4-keto-2,6-dideoxyhexose 3-C-methyltransferase